MKNNKRDILIKTIFFIITFIFFIFSAYYLKYTWDNTLAQKAEQIILLAKTAEISLNGEMLKELHALPEDIGTVPYESIKTRLNKLVGIYPNVKFAYIYTQRDNKIYFMADSEPADSLDYSPPGQEFIEANELTYRPFKDGLTIITPPYTDRWGSWVSVLVPIKDNAGVVTSVFGLDYKASDWNDEAYINISLAGLTVFISFLLLIIFYFLIKNFIKIKLAEIKFKNSEKEIETILDAIPALIFYKDDKNNFIKVNKSFADSMKMNKSQIEGKSVYDFFPKEQAEAYFKDDKEVISSGKSKLNIIEQITLPDRILWLNTDKILYKDDNNQIKGIIGFSVDITENKNASYEIESRNKDLERLNKLMVGRELEMIKMKQKIAECESLK